SQLMRGGRFRSAAGSAGKGAQSSPAPPLAAHETISVPSRMVRCAPPDSDASPTMSPSLMRHGMNLWRPFLFTGVHVAELSPDWRQARVELRLRPWNRNYVGTH